MRLLSGLLLSGLLLLSVGCETAPKEEEKTSSGAMAEIVQDDETILIYFPAHLLLEGDHLDKHGRIPSSPLVGAEIASVSNLVSVKAQYDKVLVQQGWTIETEEDYPSAFRIKAVRGTQMLEIRAVQGTAGPTQIFVLYAASMSVL